VNTLARNPRFRELLQRIGQSVHERDEHTKPTDRRNATKDGKQLDVLYDEIGLLLYHHLKPLKLRFIAGDAKAIGEVLDFLAIDLLASGTSYQKQWCYRKLNCLREIALAQYASNEYRHEDSELRRLMVRLAGAKFMEQVQAIPARSGSTVFVHKDRMLGVILARRKDLGDQLKTGQGSK
jgi:hypothetical protein